MRALGLRVVVARTKRTVFGVVLDTADRSTELIKHVSDKRHDEATRAREARDTLVSELRKYTLIDAAVLFEADYHPQARVNDGTKDRLRLEGACLAACRERIEHVKVMDGPMLGRALSGVKDDALRAADDLNVPREHRDAAAAALAAEAIGQ